MTLAASMIDWPAIKTALAGWIETDCGLPLAWANQSANPSARERPYVMIQILAARQNGVDGHIQAEASGDPYGRTRRYYGQRRIDCQVTVFAKATGEISGSAMDLAERVADTLSTDTVNTRLRAGLLGLSDVGEVRDLTALDSQAAGGRATFDVFFNYTAITPAASAETGDFIQEIAGEADIVDGNSTITVPFDVSSGA